LQYSLFIILNSELWSGTGRPNERWPLDFRLSSAKQSKGGPSEVPPNGETEEDWPSRNFAARQGRSKRKLGAICAQSQILDQHINIGIQETQFLKVSLGAEMGIRYKSGCYFCPQGEDEKKVFRAA